MTRGPDYAHRLTPRQQQTLDELLASIAPAATVVPIAGRARRSRWPAGLTAAAVITIVALAAFLASLGQVVRPAPGTPITSPSTMDTAGTLERLRAASATAPEPVLSTQDIVVAVPNGPRRNCAATGIELTAPTRFPPGGGDTTLKVSVSTLTVPAGARTWLGCLGPADPGAPINPRQKPLFAGVINDSMTWAGLTRELYDDGLILPDLVDPRTIDGRTPLASPIEPTVLATLLNKLAVTGSPRPAAWWTVAARLLGSLACTPTIRAATLGLAAGDPALLGAAEVLTDHPTDVLGRAGVTLRVPYLAGGRATTADLTFDRSTGALLQRFVWAPSGQPWTAAITAYR